MIERDLIAVLDDRPDLTALLDVTRPEPPEKEFPLYALPNVSLSAHIAGSINDEVVRDGRLCAGGIRALGARRKLNLRRFSRHARDYDLVDNTTAQAVLTIVQYGVLTGRNARIGLLKVEMALALCAVVKVTGNELGTVPQFDLEFGVRWWARNPAELAYG